MWPLGLLWTISLVRFCEYGDASRGEPKGVGFANIYAIISSDGARYYRDQNVSFHESSAFIVSYAVWSKYWRHCSVNQKGKWSVARNVPDALLLTLHKSQISWYCWTCRVTVIAWVFLWHVVQLWGWDHAFGMSYVLQSMQRVISVLFKENIPVL